MFSTVRYRCVLVLKNGRTRKLIFGPTKQFRLRFVSATFIRADILIIVWILIKMQYRYRTDRYFLSMLWIGIVLMMIRIRLSILLKSRSEAWFVSESFLDIFRYTSWKIRYSLGNLVFCSQQCQFTVHCFIFLISVIGVIIVRYCGQLLEFFRKKL